ncbi:MAG: DUF58 domain-containing protein [Mariprofundus sp.]|nr:DUF58 domain-containing protein [Mariprofundus sp.]
MQRPATALHLKAGYPRALMAGAHLSRFQGRGVEFDEVRAYQPGDDIRSMDWRVTARTGKPHTKLFREERERPALVLLDMRPAMFFATRGALKAVIATECASLLAWSVMQQGDRIGSLIFGDDNEHIQLMRPVRGKRGVLRMLGNVINQPHWQQRSSSLNESKTLEHILHRASHAAHTGSLIIIVSDGRGLNETCMNLLKRLLAHHTIVFVLIYDVFEADMPNVGQLQTSDGQQQRSIDTSNHHLRQQHHDCFSKRQALLQALARRPGFVLLQCATDDDPFSVLQASLGR